MAVWYDAAAAAGSAIACSCHAEDPGELADTRCSDGVDAGPVEEQLPAPQSYTVVHGFAGQVDN